MNIMFSHQTQELSTYQFKSAAEEVDKIVSKIISFNCQPSIKSSIIDTAKASSEANLD